MRRGNYTPYRECIECSDSGGSGGGRVSGGGEVRLRSEVEVR